MAIMKELNMSMDELLDNTQKFVLCGRAMLDAIEEISTQFAQLANEVSAKPETETQVLTKEEKTAEPQVAEEPKTATMEEVRGLLAEKSRSGFRAEVKALLTAHGVEKLSEITDPVELGKLKAEAEELGG